MLQACLDAPVAAEALMAAAGHVSRTGQFRRNIQRLLDDGLLELTVPGKPRSPAQKYRLTGVRTRRSRTYCRGSRENRPVSTKLDGRTGGERGARSGAGAEALIGAPRLR